MVIEANKYSCSQIHGPDKENSVRQTVHLQPHPGSRCKNKQHNFGVVKSTISVRADKQVCYCLKRDLCKARIIWSCFGFCSSRCYLCCESKHCCFISALNDVMKMQHYKKQKNKKYNFPVLHSQSDSRTAKHDL